MVLSNGCLTTVVNSDVVQQCLQNILLVLCKLISLSKQSLVVEIQSDFIACNAQLACSTESWISPRVLGTALSPIMVASLATIEIYKPNAVITSKDLLNTVLFDGNECYHHTSYCM